MMWRIKYFIKTTIPTPIAHLLAGAYHFSLAVLGAFVYDFPSKKMLVIGVTGTKGKSSTTEMLNAIFEAAGFKTVLINSIRFKVADTTVRNTTRMSMPGRFVIQKKLSQGVTTGCTVAILEMTSEGSRQYRHRGIDLDALIFTNLSPEHIESHGSLEEYANAKYELGLQLLRSSKRPRVMVANADDSQSGRFFSLPVETKIPFTLSSREPYEATQNGGFFTFEGTKIEVSMPGLFSLKNALAASVAARAFGVAIDHIQSGLKSMHDIPGRAEVSPVADFPGEISSVGTSGLLIDTLVVEPSYFRLAGLLPSVGKALGVDQGIVVSSQTLVALGLPSDQTTLGKSFNIKISYPNETSATDETIPSLPAPLQGIISDDSMTPTAIVYSNLFSKEPPYYRKALVKAKNVDVLEGLRDKLIADGFLVSARIDLITQARKITNIITIILGVFGVTALVVSAIGMFNTMLVGFLERIYEVGILKSLGATDYDVRNLFLVEASIMGFLGGAGGVIIGFGLGKFFNFLLSFIAIRFGGKSFDLFATPFWFVLVIMAFSTVIGFVSGWWPAHRAAGLSPKEAFTKR